MYRKDHASGEPDRSAQRAPASIRVQVLLFSMLREKVGQDAVSLVLPAPATGNDALDCLEEAYPGIKAYRPAIRLAVNRCYAAATTPLADGDEVALITPVSGG